MEQTLGGGTVETVGTLDPTTVDIRLHRTVQPFFLPLGHCLQRQASDGAQRGHQQFVVGIGRGEQLLAHSAVGVIPVPALPVETMGPGAEAEIGKDFTIA